MKKPLRKSEMVQIVEPLGCGALLYEKQFNPTLSQLNKHRGEA